MNFAGVQSVTIPEGDVKSVAIGGVTVWTKPNPLPYDAEVEYLESTGTQYVDTGVIGGSNSRVKIVASSSNNATALALFGSRESNTVAGFSVWQYATIGASSGVRFDFYGNSSATTRFVLATGQWSTTAQNTVEKSGAENWLNGVQAGSNPSASFACQQNFYLLAINTAGTASYPFVGKIYSCEIYDGSTTVRSFVPVRVGQVGYLFDRANPTGGPLGNGLYGSATATPLVAGPDKNGG